MAWNGVSGAGRMRQKMRVVVLSLFFVSAALAAPGRTLLDVAIPGATPATGTPAATPAAPVVTPATPAAATPPVAEPAVIGAAPVDPTATPVTTPVVATPAATPPVGTTATPAVGTPAVGTTATPAAGTATGPAAATPVVGTATGPATAAGVTPVVTPVAPVAEPPAEPVDPATVTQEVDLDDAIEINRTQLTAPDGFVYDFSLLDVDYIFPNEPLPHDNLTALPAVPAAAAQAYANAVPSDNPLYTWRLDILQHNKELWDVVANRKIKDAATTLIEQADIYMDEVVFLVTNKTDVQSPWEDNQDPRVYFSLSDHYWPFQVSAVNPTGIPYQYNASVNLEVDELTPNKRHLEDTMEHISTLALAWFFSGNQAYSDRAREKAFAWFLDPETAMVAQYAGRLAAVRRGGTQFGRPEGIFDMNRLPDLLNGVTLLESSPSWSAADTQAMAAWIADYVGFLEGDPVAKYARMMGNFIATNVDEQLIAAYLYLEASGGDATAREKATQIAHFSSIRQEDQIVDGVFIYESPRQRSLDFTQQCLLSWVNIAIMSERLGINVWERGLGEGWSIKDAFDHNRPFFESLGVTWTFIQVGTPRVRVAGELIPPIYVGYRLGNRINSGPVEYIELYETIWEGFNTAGSQARGIISRLSHVEMDGILAEEGFPLIEECESLWCDTRTLAIWGVTAVCIMMVMMCFAWNRYIHWKADRETDVPAFLQNIREQQAKYKRMNLKVAPAKPDYMIERKVKDERRRMEEKLAREEEKKDKELKQKIKQTEEKLQRRRDSKMQSHMTSQMQSQMMPQPYGSNMMGMPGSMVQPGMASQYAPSVASQSHHGGSSFHPAYDAQSDVASSVNGHNGMNNGMGMGYSPGYSPGYTPGYSPAYGMAPQYGAQAYGMAGYGGMSPDGYGMPSGDGYGMPSPNHNVQGQVIMEEGQAPEMADFSFPGVQELDPQDGYGDMGGPTGALYEAPPPPGQDAAGPHSFRSMEGNTNPLSTGTGPSQGLTGLLAGAQDLLGEMGTTQTTAALTGTFTGPPGSRNQSFRQTKPADSH